MAEDTPQIFSRRARGNGPDILASGQRLTAAEVQRHSARIRHFRLVVPAAALGLLATYALSATPPKIDPSFEENFTQSDVESDGMRLDRPRYAGEDLEGQAFEVAAISAQRDPSAPELITLQNPEALRDIDPSKASEEVAVSAKSGLLNTEKKTVDLNEEVRFEHNIGGAPVVINTDAATVDLNANTVRSVVGIVGTGESGSVSADEAVVYQDDGRTVLTGNVKLRLNGRTAEDSSNEGLR